MNAEIKKKWIDALRSGEYKQGKSFLQKHNLFCCLGVLCDLHSKENDEGFWQEAQPGETSGGLFYGLFIDDKKELKYSIHVSSSSLPPVVIDWANKGIPANIVIDKIGEINGNYIALTQLNDSGKSFAEIANIIEEKF